MKRWHALALPHIETKGLTETWIDFLQAWPRVKSPKGAKMATIMEKALQAPMPKAAERYEEEPIRRLVALCRQLDRGRAEARSSSCVARPACCLGCLTCRRIGGCFSWTTTR